MSLREWYIVVKLAFHSKVRLIKSVYILFEVIDRYESMIEQ